MLKPLSVSLSLLLLAMTVACDSPHTPRDESEDVLADMAADLLHLPWIMTKPESRTDQCERWSQDPQQFTARVLDGVNEASILNEDAVTGFYGTACDEHLASLPLSPADNCTETVKAALHLSVYVFQRDGYWQQDISEFDWTTSVDAIVYQSAAADIEAKGEFAMSSHVSVSDMYTAIASSCNTSAATAEVEPFPADYTLPDELPQNLETCKDIALFFWPYLSSTQDAAEITRRYFNGTMYNALNSALSEIAAGAGSPSMDPLTLIDDACAVYDSGWSAPGRIRTDLDPVSPATGLDFPSSLPENLRTCQDVVVYFSPHLQEGDPATTEEIMGRYFPEGQGSLGAAIRSANGDPYLAVNPLVVAERVCTTGPSS